MTTEIDQSRQQINETLHAVNEIGLPVLWFWPNVDAGADGTSSGIRTFREVYNPKQIHFFKNMEGKDFLKILLASKCLIGNSSVGIRECSFLGVPVINIGSRQNKRERGRNIIDVQYDKDQIKKAIEYWLLNPRPSQSFVYGGGNAGKQMADLLSKIELRFSKTISF